MNINYLEILDLTGNPSEELIKQKLGEKLSYFSMLIKNAPTRHLKMIYEKNIEQLNEISINLGVSVDFDEPIKLTNSTNEKQLSTAVLIRHTEDKSPVSFLLRNGINYIGRDKFSKNVNVVIDDDDFVSKQHAVVELESINPFKAVIYDIGMITGKNSTNGVYVNGMENRINQKLDLKDNDTIQVGYTKLIFKLTESNRLDKAVEEVDSMEFTKTVFIKIN